MMRAMRLEEPGPAHSDPLHSRDVAAPEPAADEILITVAACAVCRTDLQLVEGDIAMRRRPVTPGHQAIGRVSGLGSAVTGFTLGDRVGVGWLGGTCGVCPFCTTGRENLCESAEFTGWDRDGGFAEQMSVRADFAFAVPDALDDMAVAPLMCGGVIGFRSLRVSGIAPNGRLGLFGFGASALLTLQVALHRGCEVFVWSRSERERQRATAMGAAWAGGLDDAAPVRLDAAITFAPVGDVVVRALRALAPGGTVAINAIHLDRIPEFDYDLLWRERSIRSVANFTRRDATDFLKVAAEARVTTAITSFTLGDANAALRAIADGTVAGAAVLEVA